ncbi:hypothetical protein, partial [Micromonospora sp. NPDC005174]|uniref:hypothetical protein n=1 Tax=Micromonospora sp. NPDC005174 TaxID=3157018 RepID=UPI0033B50C26
MSYDLAVWEGGAPTDDGEGRRVFQQLYRKYIDTEDETPPTPRIRSYYSSRRSVSGLDEGLSGVMADLGFRLVLASEDG